jgi:hypothetical protein
MCCLVEASTTVSLGATNFANIIPGVIWEIARRQVFACNVVSRFGCCSSSFR